MTWMRTAVLKIYYSDTVGISLGWMGFTVVLAVIVDALTDPISASVTDAVRTPWGRRRPFMFLAGPIAGLIFVAMWSYCPIANVFDGGACDPEQPTRSGAVGAPELWFMFVYVAHFVSLDLLWVPYFALGPELTPDTRDQGALFAVMRGTEILGIGAGVVLPGIVVVTLGAIWGYFTLSVVICVYLIATLWLLVFTTKERIADKEDKPQRPMVPSVLECLYNPLFRIVLAGEIIEQAGSSFQWTVMPYVVAYLLEPSTLEEAPLGIESLRNASFLYSMCVAPLCFVFCFDV